MPEGMTYTEWREKYVDKPDSDPIISIEGGVGVQMVGEINPKLFQKISPILTKDVVITERQIAHIKESHPLDYERYAEYIPAILREPDYIIEANKPNSAVLLKEILEGNERFQLILRLKTPEDPASYQNSVISFWKIDKRRYDNYVRNKKIVYKSE